MDQKPTQCLHGAPKVSASRLRTFGVCAVLTAALICANAPKALAAVVTFQLQNVTFKSGGTATGTFTIDEAMDVTTAVDITYTAPSVVFHFTDAETDGTACGVSVNMTNVGFCNLSTLTNPILALDFNDPFGTTAKTIASGSYDINRTSDAVTGGSIAPVVASVPEPATLAVLGSALVVCLGIGRTWRRHSAPV